MTLHPGIDRSVYDSLPGINWSSLKQGQGRTGVHIECALNGMNRSDSAAMKFGRALHQSILQPELFLTSWAIKPGVKTTTVPDMLTESEHAAITAMTDKFRSLKLVIEQTEMALTWERGGYQCKGSIDALAGSTLIDLKTTDDASPAAMATTSWRYNYHGQMAWYRHGLIANGIPVTACVIVAMEKTPPYAIGVYTLSPFHLQTGDTMADKLLALYRDRTIEDYPPQILPVPPWALDPDALTESA